MAVEAGPQQYSHFRWACLQMLLILFHLICVKFGLLFFTQLNHFHS